MDEWSTIYGNNYGKTDDQQRRANFLATTLSLLVVTPFLVYVTILAMFTFVNADSPTVVWLWVTACAGTSFMLLCLPNNRPDGQAFYTTMGLLSLLAVVISTLCGLINWHQNMSFYTAYNGLRQYSNVVPTEPALSHLDAGRISFSSDTKLNTRKALGYKAGSMYCVVPVIDATPQSQKKVEYFAAGVDCCEARGSFTCDEASDPKARAGLVYLRGKQDSLLTDFRKAAQEVAAQNGVTVSEDAIFVQWLRDPERAVNSYNNAGVDFFLVTSLVYLVVSTAMGFLLHFSQRHRTRIAKSHRDDGL